MRSRQLDTSLSDGHNAVVGCHERARSLFDDLHAVFVRPFLVHVEPCKIQWRMYNLFRHLQVGGMAEWLKAAVLKTVRGVTPSWVRILLPPPHLFAPTIERHRELECDAGTT
jgi:hypothetical protein